MPHTKKARVTRASKRAKIFLAQILDPAPPVEKSPPPAYVIHRFALSGVPFAGGPRDPEPKSLGVPFPRIGERPREMDPGWYDALNPSWTNPIYLLIEGPKIFRSLFSDRTLRWFVEWRLSKHPLSEYQRRILRIAAISGTSAFKNRRPQ